MHAHGRRDRQHVAYHDVQALGPRSVLARVQQLAEGARRSSAARGIVPRRYGTTVVARRKEAEEEDFVIVVVAEVKGSKRGAVAERYVAGQVGGVLLQRGGKRGHPGVKLVGESVHHGREGRSGPVLVGGGFYRPLDIRPDAS